MIKPSELKKKEKEIKENLAWRNFVYAARELSELQKRLLEEGLPYTYTAFADEWTGLLSYKEGLLFHILVRNGYKCRVKHIRGEHTASVTVDYPEEDLCQ